jgi:DnaJ-domain-containing protein 1
MPTDFLLQQLELREELESAVAKKDGSALDALRRALANSKTLLERQIGEAIDSRNDHGGAADLVRKLMFLDRLHAEIDAAYEEIE